MPRRKTASALSPEPASDAPTSEEVAELTQAVAELARQTRQLGLILDDLREDLIHAVRNGSLAGIHPRDQWRPVVTPSAPLEHARAERTPMANAKDSEAKPPPTPPPPQATPATEGQGKLFS